MGTCGTLCAADSECRADRWCNATNGVCEADRVNTTDDCERPAQCRSNVCNADKKCGESSGEQCGAAYQCRANVCFAEDTECGLPNSEACTSAAVCRSSLCFTDGLCGKPNGESCMALTECRSNKCVGMVCSGCATDAECSATQFCDTTEGDCAPKRPDGQACSSPNQCVSAMCSPEGTCGNPEKPLTLDDVSVSGGACNATGNGAVPWGSLFLVLFAMVSLRRRRAD